MAGARTREIADACGINEALLYKHFKGKDELFREAMSRIYDSMAINWRAIAHAAPTGREALDKVLEHQVANLFSNGPYCANMVHGVSAATSDDEMRKYVHNWFRKQHEFIVSLIKRGMQDGSFRDNLVPDRFAFAIRGMTWSLINSIAVDMNDFITPDDAMGFYKGLSRYLAGEPIE
jgi:AcrR family transcriptional regulator